MLMDVALWLWVVTVDIFPWFITASDIITMTDSRQSNIKSRLRLVFRDVVSIDDVDRMYEVGGRRGQGTRYWGGAWQQETGIIVPGYSNRRYPRLERESCQVRQASKGRSYGVCWICRNVYSLKDTVYDLIGRKEWKIVRTVKRNFSL